MSDRIGRRWIALFRGDTEFYSAAYFDLFKALWRADGPVRKTDAMNSMKAVRSAHTAGKYVDTALRRGLVVESANPEDGRSKLLSLSDEMRQRLDTFFDQAMGEVQRTGRLLEGTDPIAKAS